MLSWLSILALFALFDLYACEHPSWVVNVPKHPWQPQRAGDLMKSSKVEDLTTAAVGNLGITKKKKKKAVDGESLDAMINYFWGMTNGIALEMGAINGNWSSESLMLESMGWKRVLIEGSPQFKEGLAAWPEAYAYSAAVCATESIVHYAVNKNYFVSGIIEFMPVDYLQQWYKGIYLLGSQTGTFNTSTIDWTQFQNKRKRVEIFAVECLPMAKMLLHSGLRHINLMILDVEGAEVVALSSIDFSAVKFDVIVVENNREQELLAFFNGSDYKLDMRKGRNLWYIHKSFTPSRAPAKRQSMDG